MTTKDDFVFHTLSDKSNWTEDAVTKLMYAAHVAPKPSEETCRKMACKFLWLLKRSKSGWIPTQSCVDLTTTGAALTDEEEKMSVEEVRELWNTEPAKIRRSQKSRAQRHFKKCEQCGRRFLARRNNQRFDTKKCGLRWNRVKASAPMMLETAQRLLEPA